MASQQTSLGQIETATTASADALAVIQEEISGEASTDNLLVELSTTPINPCICKLPSVALKDETEETVAPEVDPAMIEELLKAREVELRAEFAEQMEEEINKLKEKFNFILHNEQVRALVMLREAHRERREKIGALHTQLECKNMSGLMYVMCAERRKCRFEKMALTQEYTAYIHALQSILVEAQALILNLSRGYKTAGRVDREWRFKMQKVIREFQKFVVHYMGEDEEACQYLFDIPKLLSTEAPVEDNPVEDPCTCEEEEEKESSADEDFEEPTWWHGLDRDCRPFVMFGDCPDLKPTQRRQLVMKLQTAEQKTAPKKWKEYKFNEMFINADCSNVGAIKDEYSSLPLPPKWECQANQTPDHLLNGFDDTRRNTTTSVDVRGNMGSILKIVTSHTNYVPQPAKTALLAARDSMEIASSTKILHHNVRGSSFHPNRSDAPEIKLDITKRRQSVLAEEEQEDEARFEEVYHEQLSTGKTCVKSEDLEEDDDADEHEEADLASIVNDSLDLAHKPCADATININFEKVCPMEKCQRMKVDSFLRSLPPYMRASPFVHFEQTYEDYETCTKEQLDLLMQRVADKALKGASHAEVVDPMDEWVDDRGVATQTSRDSALDHAPCTCKGPSPTPVSSYSGDGQVYDMSDLVPMKQMVNLVGQACFYDEEINFDRFKVLGRESRERIVTDPPKRFMQSRIDEIKKILKRNPSLLDMFQANTQC